MKKIFVYSKEEILKLIELNNWDIDTLKNSNISLISINNTIDEFDTDLDDWTTEFLFSNSKLNIDEGENIISLRVKDDSEDFSPEMARSIINFILKNKEKDFYIHCIMGKSRSQAVAKFILDTWPDNYIYARGIENPLKTPNYHILSTLKRVWRFEFEDKNTSV